MRTIFWPARVFGSFGLAVVLLSGCGGGGSDSLAANTNVPLTPARALEGTWKTPLAFTMNYQSDFRTGAKETIGSTGWQMTWIITPVSGFTNVVDVEVRASYPSTTIIAGSSWVPLVSPTFLRGTMSSSEIVLKDSTGTINVSGAFTSSNMGLTWVHWECLIYCTGEFTATAALKLQKQ